MAKVQFVPYSCNDTLLFPANLGDFIPVDAPVRLINEVVDSMDISSVIRSYSNGKDGRPAYHPRMLLKEVLFGYFMDIFSTRELAEAMKRDVHLIWLSGYQYPDHSTISRFKSRCADSIKAIFSSLVCILAQKGEIELSEDLYIDGTTIRSRAARRKIRWRSSAERKSALANDKIQKAIESLLESIDESDRNELIQEGRTEYTPAQARELAKEVEQRVAKSGHKVKGKIKTVLEACDSKEAHDETIEQCHGKCGVSPTDPQCGIMHAKEDGYDAMATPNYNVQAATQNQYVTNYDVFDTPSDMSTALDFVDTCIAENGVKPQAVVEDAGYGSEEVYVGLEQRGIEAVVKYPNYDRDTKQRRPNPAKFDKHGFVLTPEQDNLICPAGHVMKITDAGEAYTTRGFRSEVTKFTCSHLCDCPFKDRCPVATNQGNTISRRLGNMRQEALARDRLSTPENRARLRRRSLEPEPVFGQLKNNHGYQRFRHFGKAKVRMDLGLMFMALNLRKLYKNTTPKAS